MHGKPREFVSLHTRSEKKNKTMVRSGREHRRTGISATIFKPGPELAAREMPSPTNSLCNLVPLRLFGCTVPLYILHQVRFRHSTD